MLDVIIVGGGLFGSIAAANLRSSGMDVLVLDDGRPRSGSRAAGCLMKPSWLSKMGKANVDKSFEVLDRLYGLKTVELWAGPLKVNAQWVNPDLVMNHGSGDLFDQSGKVRQDYIKAEVVEVGSGYVKCWVPSKQHAAPGMIFHARHVIVAAGAWTKELIPSCEVVGKVGVSVRLAHPPVDNRIEAWAPYKQLVRFAAEGFAWAGDGTAILDANWTRARREQSLKRILTFAGKAASGEVREGIRPYVKTEDPAALKQEAFGLWSLTGGGKNGTAAAGWAAAQLVERLT